MDEAIRQEYLNKHLPYRINSMLSPDLIEHRRNNCISEELKNRCFSDSLILEPTFEISIIFGRSLLNFLEIGNDKQNNKLIKYNSQHDDITIKSLYPNISSNPIDDEIVTQFYSNFCTIIKIANKSVAHLSSKESSPGEHALLRDARIGIYRLILKYVPDINKNSAYNKTGIWWYEQVECA
ncbi:MAG: hypothetical protein IM591_00715 [Chitinophagaceae bacterium]|nr:hypothetical protein [Chitinophagaceae bacterium]MCA6488520.1 hypothetical protein [Chitinophagaceae bacterium]